MIKGIASINFISMIFTAGHISCGILISKNKKPLIFWGSISCFYLLALTFYSFSSYLFHYFALSQEKFTMNFIS